MKSFADALKQTSEIGRVNGVNGTIARLEGLPHAKCGDMVLFETGQTGYVFSLGLISVSVIVFSREPLKVETKAVLTGSEIGIKVSTALLGTTISALGKSYTKKTTQGSQETLLPLFSDPLGIDTRVKISRSLSTGVAIIDRIVPLGYGQRELIIGDRKTGKTQLVLSAMQTQCAAGTIVIYTAIGKPKGDVKLIEKSLKERNILDHAIIVFASAYASPGEIYVAPYTAMTIAEYFCKLGKDVLVILDDLTTHARYYRELSLLSDRFPGRDSYPGDIFHVHAKLLERAGNYCSSGKEASITALPLAETAGSDMTGYIQTNLMSMTDGHLFCDSDLFFRGLRPSINPFLSVTRVGRQTQTPLGRDVAGKLLTMLTQYEKALQFVRFGADVSDELKHVLVVGEALWRVFRQSPHEQIATDLQYALIARAYEGTMTDADKRAYSQTYEKSVTEQKKVNKAVSESKTLEELREKLGK